MIRGSCRVLPRRSVWLLTASILVIVTGAWAEEATSQPALDLDTVRKWRSHLLRFDAAFTLEKSYTPNLVRVRALLGNEAADKAITGTRTFGVRFVFDHGMIDYTSDLSKETLRSFEGKVQAEPLQYHAIYGKDRVETLVKHSATNITGMISEEQDYPDSAVIDVAFGLRGFGDNQWIDDTELTKSQIRRNGESITLTRAGANGTQHTWNYEGGATPTLKSYEMRLSDGLVVREISNEEMKQIDGVRIPMKVLLREIAYDEGKRVVTSSTTLHLQTCDLGKDARPQSAFAMLWPKGTIIRDSRIDMHIKVSSGDRILSDKDVYEALRAKTDSQITTRAASTSPSTEAKP